MPHYTEKKILHSTQEMQNSIIIYHVGHVIACIFQKYPLHNNIERHMAYGDSILNIKCVSSFSTNTKQNIFHSSKYLTSFTLNACQFVCDVCNDTLINEEIMCDVCYILS